MGSEKKIEIFEGLGAKEYVAIKVSGMDHWLWFESIHVTYDGFSFIGKHGWGPGGADTSINVLDDTIEGKIASKELQYDED